MVFFFGDLKGDLHSDSERSERSAERASHPDATDPGGWTELVGSSGDPGGTEKGGKRNVWARTRPVRARTEEPGVFKVLGEQRLNRESNRPNRQLKMVRHQAQHQKRGFLLPPTGPNTQ